MLVSWNWLKDYVQTNCPHDELTLRLAMSGLNHEETTAVGGDLCIDLEVTSNRPDCLGHIGIAREIAVLDDLPLTIPEASPPTSKEKVAGVARVAVECPDLCPRYTARVIRNVKVGPSPAWLVERLAAIGIETINNVVDATNYVMMECGQPLHAFDFDLLRGKQIVVRRPRKGERLEAINHRIYDLTDDMCVIADAERPVALGGVMGGAATEVSPRTVNLLIEAAEFAPLSIRATARALNLHSPSSYRFERPIDSHGVDWASRRCCQLILELAGGELLGGAIDVPGPPVHRPTPITLRLAQVERILGIEIPAEQITQILAALGCDIRLADGQGVELIPPTWRRDLTREVDLIEEVGRIYGYDKVPEDVAVPMAASHRRDIDRIQAKIREVLVGCGFDEALTASVVGADWSEAFSPWTAGPALQAYMPMLRGADRLRRSLIPSLLGARQFNESLANPVVELYEIAKVYLPTDETLPREELMLALCSGGEYHDLKGAIETLVAALGGREELEVASADDPLLDPIESCRLLYRGEMVGILGKLAPAALKQFGLRQPAVAAELRMAFLQQIALLVPQYRRPSPFPPIQQDLNLVVDESLRWAELAATVRAAAGSMLEELSYRETYRDAKNDGPGKKRLLFSFQIRSEERTLTGDDAEQVRGRIIQACRENHQAVLLG